MIEVTGRRAGAAVVPRDQDHVGLGLGHARRDGADARLADQLHADLGARVDLLEVVDQLRQILDRIDVVVRRRRDQRHARRRMPQPRDQLGHLDAGQLAALAGLRALGDLDLQLLALVEVLGRHAEPPRRHLLDLGARRCRRSASAGNAPDPRRPRRSRDFAPIRFIAMFSVLCASGPSAPSDMPGVTNRLRIAVIDLDLLQRRRRRLGGEVQQVAQVDRRPRLHRLRVLLPQLVVAPRRRPTAACASPALPRRGSRRSAAPCRSRRSAARCRPPPKPRACARSIWRCSPLTPMPEIRLAMPGKYSATIARLRPTASKFSPPR